MCGSALSVKGGMVSVVKNYLNYKNWGDIKVDYIPTPVSYTHLTLPTILRV